MTTIHPVILCGGSGTRLWPLSRRSFPKQFTALAGERTLFQQSAARVAGVDRAGVLAFAPPMVLTNSAFRFIVTEQLMTAGIDPGPILIEPEGRNTGPAILAAALVARDRDPNAVLLVTPSDHVIPDTGAFHAAVARGLPAVQAGNLVTFGITPDRPKTGYGYLELSERPGEGNDPIGLARFVEKPDRIRAETMLAKGHFLWNAGIFLFSAKDMVAAYEIHAPDLMAPVRTALDAVIPDLGSCD